MFPENLEHRDRFDNFEEYVEYLEQNPDVKADVSLLILLSTNRLYELIKEVNELKEK